MGISACTDPGAPAAADWLNRALNWALVTQVGLASSVPSPTQNWVAWVIVGQLTAGYVPYVVGVCWKE